MSRQGMEKDLQLPNVKPAEDRPWWEFSSKPSPSTKCPLCNYRMCTTKTLGKNEHSCFECASLHYRTIRVEVEGEQKEITIYMTTESLLQERQKQRKLLEEQRKPRKKENCEKKEKSSI